MRARKQSKKEGEGEREREGGYREIEREETRSNEVVFTKTRYKTSIATAQWIQQLSNYLFLKKVRLTSNCETGFLNLTNSNNNSFKPGMFRLGKKSAPRDPAPEAHQED